MLLFRIAVFDVQMRGDAVWCGAVRCSQSEIMPKAKVSSEFKIDTRTRSEKMNKRRLSIWNSKCSYYGQTNSKTDDLQTILCFLRNSNTILGSVDGVACRLGYREVRIVRGRGGPAGGR